mgnify:CR=1 FL=1
MGCKKLNLSKKNLKLDKSQAIASIGQIELMNLFSQTFSKYKLNKNDYSRAQKYADQTISLPCHPEINESDIKFITKTIRNILE